MAVSMDELTMSRLGALRSAASRRRVRALLAGRPVADADDVLQVWEPYRVVGSYAFATADVNAALVSPTPVVPVERRPPVLTPVHQFSLHTCAGTSWDIEVTGRVLPAAAFTPDDPDLTGRVILDWAAFDEWREEDQVVLSHPHDPFQRIDCLASSRHVVVSIGEVVLADSHRPTLLLETHLPPRHYLPREDVRMDRLTPSETRTTCAYKGHATYWSAVVGDRVVPDVAWTYRRPLLDGQPIRDMICFYDDRVDVTVTPTTP